MGIESAKADKYLLNNKEFQLMEYFMMNSNQVLSTDLIMGKIWGLDSDAEINVVWVNISSLVKISEHRCERGRLNLPWFGLSIDGRSVIPMILEKKRSLHV